MLTFPDGEFALPGTLNRPFTSVATPIFHDVTTRMGVESMGTFKMLLAILVTASLTFVADAVAQPMRGEEKRIEGQVKSINPPGTEVTLTDGTTLVTPPGAAIRPGVITEGATVVAIYIEQNGQKVMIELGLMEPSASPPTEPRSPGGRSPAPPSESPKRL